MILRGRQLEKTVSQVADEIGVSNRALQEALEKGRLAGRKISPKLWLIEVDDPKYQQFLAEHQKWLQARGRTNKGQETI